MIKVMTVNHAAEAQLIRGLLQAEGIAVEIRGEGLSHVWILQDPQVPRALEILDCYSREPSAPGRQGGVWLCPGCGAEHGPEFQGCWHCGTLRPVTV
jgi:hypothetical protein